jgi:hypothetical protein
MPKITELYAYVVDDGDGDEGIPAVLQQGSWVPFIGADLETLAYDDPAAALVMGLRLEEEVRGDTLSVEHGRYRPDKDSNPRTVKSLLTLVSKNTWRTWTVFNRR